MTEQEIQTENPRKRGYRPVHQVLPVEIAWIEGSPPEPGAGHHSSFDHFRIARELRDHPYRWAWLIGMTLHGPSSINKGTLAAYRPSGSYQCSVVEGQVYARYVGDPAGERAVLGEQGML